MSVWAWLVQTFAREMPVVTEKLGEVAGRARAAAAALLGQRGILLALKLEHGELRVWLRRMASARDPQTRGELLRLLNVELMAHARAKEATFYRALAGHGMTEPLAERGIHEHRQLIEHLRRLQALPTDNAEWPDQAQALMQLFEQHVHFEEGKTFVLAQDVLETADLQRLGSEFKAIEGEMVRRMTVA